MNRQSSFLEPPRDEARSGRLDAATEAALDRYARFYASERSAGAVRGEVSQLSREARAVEGLTTLADAIGNVPCLVRILTMPRERPSAATASRRLSAIQHAMMLLLGADDGRRGIVELRARLPQRDLTDWHESGVVIAGDTKRRRPTCPSISPADLVTIVQSVAECRHATRDRAIVAVHCFSGLTAAEIRTLSWDSVRWENEFETWSVAVKRGDTRTRLAIFGAAVPLLAQLRLRDSPGDRTVFRNPRGTPLTSVQLRRVVGAACERAGFPGATRADLLSAITTYLHEAGFTEHQIAIALGTHTVATIDRRLRPHLALKAQRTLHTEADCSDVAPRYGTTTRPTPND